MQLRDDLISFLDDPVLEQRVPHAACLDFIDNERTPIVTIPVGILARRNVRQGLLRIFLGMARLPIAFPMKIGSIETRTNKLRPANATVVQRHG